MSCELSIGEVIAHLSFEIEQSGTRLLMDTLHYIESSKSLREENARLNERLASTTELLLEANKNTAELAAHNMELRQSMQ